MQHAPEQHLPTRPGDPTPQSRNLDPLMHPFARARERTRALNAAKMDRIFAKPFITALEGHTDAIESMAKQPDSLVNVTSGSWGGGAHLGFFQYHMRLTGAHSDLQNQNCNRYYHAQPIIKAYNCQNSQGA